VRCDDDGGCDVITRFGKNGKQPNQKSTAAGLFVAKNVDDCLTFFFSDRRPQSPAALMIDGGASNACE
jgi:hypothetical protein